MSNGYGRSSEGFGIDRGSSVNLIVKTALEHGVTDPRQISYMLATAQHETRNFTAPEEDFGRSQARKLGYRGGEEYFGRGYVHLTHIENYQQFDKLLGLKGELIKNPALATDPEVAAKILVVGMRDGLFTGKRLDRYIDADSHDLYNARRTVNGVIPLKPWSIEAAKNCERYAEAWEKKVPGLIEGVKRNGADLHFDTASPVHRSTHASHGPSADGVFRQGEKGDDVRGLQEQLNKLGYRDAQGHALKADGDFGKHTKEAVEAFQQARGLKVDGIAGPKTLEALHQPNHKPQLTNPAHPDHALYQQALEAVHQAEDGRKIGPGAHSVNLAAALVVEAKREGITWVDRVELNNDGTLARAVQVNPTRDDPPLNKNTDAISTKQAIAQPVRESSEQLEQVSANLQARQAAERNQTQSPAFASL